VLRHLSPDRTDKTLYGWTASLFDSASHAKLFGAPIAASFRSPAKDLALLHADGTTVKVVAAILVATMIVTTYLTSRQMILKTGWSEDRQQKLMQQLMLYGIPFSLLISGTLFPIGVVIYWVTTNLFSLGQQFWVLRKYPPPVTATAGATKTGAAGSSGSLADLILGRKPKKATPAAASGTPKVEAKALGPKPGAKPVNPKKVPARTATSKAMTPKPATPNTAAVKAAKATPAKNATPAKAAKATKRPTG
jgi:YidC/Oxa1 family membrane protein insertase